MEEGFVIIVSLPVEIAVVVLSFLPYLDILKLNYLDKNHRQWYIENNIEQEAKKQITVLCDVFVRHLNPMLFFVLREFGEDKAVYVKELATIYVQRQKLVIDLLTRRSVLIPSLVNLQWVNRSEGKQARYGYDQISVDMIHRVIVQLFKLGFERYN